MNHFSKLSFRYIISSRLNLPWNLHLEVDPCLEGKRQCRTRKGNYSQTETKRITNLLLFSFKCFVQVYTPVMSFDRNFTTRHQSRSRWEKCGRRSENITYRGQFNDQLVLVCFIQPVIFLLNKNGKYTRYDLKTCYHTEKNRLRGS